MKGTWFAVLVACVGPAPHLLCDSPATSSGSMTMPDATCRPMHPLGTPGSTELCAPVTFCCDGTSSCWFEENGEEMDPLGDGLICENCLFEDAYEAAVRPMLCEE